MSAQLDISRLQSFLKADEAGTGDMKSILRLTEVMTDSMLDVIRDRDEQTYETLCSIAKQINDTKRELAEFRVEEMRDLHIPEAGRELDAVVDATEAATDRIMEAAEDIMSADAKDHDAYVSIVNDKVITIFEACSFQDITGQRIAKVVKSLSFIDAQIDGILGRFDKNRDLAGAPSGANTRSHEEELLNGPALAGRGVSQSDVDDFFK